jgi:hypothetical protein
VADIELPCSDQLDRDHRPGAVLDRHIEAGFAKPPLLLRQKKRRMRTIRYLIEAQAEFVVGKTLRRCKRQDQEQQSRCRKPGS